MFVGQTIRSVIYGALKYFADENGDNVNPVPSYKTKYPEIDSLDHSIYFKTDNKTIYVSWDNTFTCYGILSKQIDLTTETNNYEQKWDVSTNEKWVDLIGAKIVDFKILWEETWTSNSDGSNKVYATYPQTFEIQIESGKSIYIIAGELKEGEDEYYSQMDNLLVTTNLNLLKQLEMEQQKQVEKYHSMNSIWVKLFG